MFLSTNDPEFWMNTLLQYRSNPRKNNILKLCKSLSNDVDLEGQFEYISELPNFNNWRWQRENIKARFEMHFSTSTG